jgi:DNA polymerase-1
MLWQADYSQLELRIFASVTKTRWMVETFLDPDGDIHAATALQVLGIPKENQTKSVRTRAKTLNFGMAYGAQGETVEEQITIYALRYPELDIDIPPLVECKAMVDKFWKKSPEAVEWKDYVVDVARDRGYTETLYGRRRYYPFIRSMNRELSQKAEREAINHIIQGTAADIIKMAALMLWRVAPDYQADIRSQIHDELFGFCFGDTVTNMKWLQVVERFCQLDQPLGLVPLRVKPKLVDNWKQVG